ncbi:sensor histidine kinase [Paenibacillus sp. NPDC058071]|uniref:sensor histidine kinase n=1 Tax=Paenibacillus sp. NPDC058071 TaxID=3346326 RepID=UPI0036DADCC0
MPALDQMLNNKGRIALAAILSALLATLAGRAVLDVFIQIEPYRKWLVWVVQSIGSTPVLVVFFVAFAGGLYAALTGRFLKNKEERATKINRQLEQGVGMFRTIRWRFLFRFLGSVLVTASLLLAGHAFVAYSFYKNPDNPGLRWIINHVGSPAIISVSGIVLFFIVFIAMTQPIINGLKDITQGVQLIAKGRLDAAIPVKSADELGLLAHHINRMSKQLSQSIEEERHAEKTKNDLITGVSHDLRTPLTSILGFLEAIENDRYKDEVELRYYVNIAHEKSVGLKNLIDHLFEYTKYNHSVELELRELDLVGFLRQLAEEYVPALENAGMSCRIEAQQEPVVAMAEGESLVRVFENLLSNAINYGSQGKLVDIRVGTDEEFAVIAFVNYGQSIPQQDIPYLFERFYRADPSRSKHTGGTGLGLAIAKSIVEKHGGTISVRSGKRETVFEVRLPLSSKVE